MRKVRRRACLVKYSGLRSSGELCLTWSEEMGFTAVSISVVAYYKAPKRRPGLAVRAHTGTELGVA